MKSNITQRLYNEASRQLQGIYHDARTKCHLFSTGRALSYPCTPESGNPYQASNDTYTILIENKNYNLLGKVAAFNNKITGQVGANLMSATNGGINLLASKKVNELEHDYPVAVNIINDFTKDDLTRLKKLFEQTLEKTKVEGRRQDAVNTLLSKKLDQLQLKLASLSNIEEIEGFLTEAKAEFAAIVEEYNNKQ